MSTPTLSVTLDIDISPEGIIFTIEGIENEIASLIKEAKTFEVIEKEYRSVDTSDITIRSIKALQFIDRAESGSTDVPSDNIVSDTSE